MFVFFIKNMRLIDCDLTQMTNLLNNKSNRPEISYLEASGFPTVLLAVSIHKHYYCLK